MYAVLLSMTVFVAVVLVFIALWVAVDLFASGGHYPRTWIVAVFKRLAKLAVPDQTHHLDTVQLDSSVPGITLELETWSFLPPEQCWLLGCRYQPCSLPGQPL